MSGGREMEHLPETSIRQWGAGEYAAMGYVRNPDEL